MSESRLPPDWKQILRRVMAPYADESARRTSEMFFDLRDRAYEDPKLGGDPRIELMVLLAAARSGAAGLMACALTLMSHDSWHKIDVNTIATSFAEAFNNHLRTIHRLQLEKSQAECDNPEHDHEREPQIEITLNVKVIEHPKEDS